MAVSLGRAQGSEWKWLTGGNLKAVKFVGQKGWIIGDDGNQGIILHTTDGGDTWAIQPHNTGKHYFRGLSFADSLNGVIVGGFRSMGEPGFIMKSSDGGQSWNLRTSPTTYNLVRVCFWDTLHIWITSDTNAIFRTTDGGNTWEGDSVDTGYQGIDFVDSNKGFAVSGVGIFNIVITTDGGRTWTLKQDNTTVSTSSIDMADSMRGWSCGLPNEVVLTSDGWQTWAQVPCGGGGSLNDISFQDTLNGLMVGGGNNHHAQYYKTTDGGLTWTVDSLTRNWYFNGVDAKQLPAAWMAGDGGSILKTTTSGNTWKIISNVDITYAKSLNNVFFKDSNQGWAVGTYGAITHTTNGGMVWQWQNAGTQNFLNGVDFATNQRGWVCSWNGDILTTANAGSNWAPQISNTTYPLFSIEFLPNDTLYGWAVGGNYVKEPPKSGIRDQGLGVSQGEMALQIANCKLQTAKWTANGEIASSSRYKQEFLRYSQDKPRNDTLSIWGAGNDFWKWPWRPEEVILQTPNRVITRTTNGGVLWIAQNSSGQVPLYGVSFVTRAEGWACGDPQGGMGVILHTADSGATWQSQSSNVNQFLNWIQFKDALTGWCVGGNGTALWTTDGGNTWNLGNTGTTAPLWSCAFYDSLHGFACGDNGLLIKTVDGGRNWTSDTSMVYANLTAVNALDSLHAWTVGSLGMVLGWREAGMEGVEIRPEGRRQLAGDRLEQSYPNPMKDECVISYSLLANNKAELSIYDVTGRTVRKFDGSTVGQSTPGRHTIRWDGKNENGKNAAPGVYFYQLRTQEKTETRKLIKIN